MLLTHVGQMLYSMQSCRQWTVGVTGLNIEIFFYFYSKEMFLEL